MPVHFLPRASKGCVGADVLCTLGVAAKLEYARNRWIDEIVDAGCRGSVSAVHRLDEALVELVHAKYSEVVFGAIAAEFFTTLAVLYARHSASLAIDGAPFRQTTVESTRKDYRAHARSRHASVRASIDAVLMLSGAPAKTITRARESWHLWALGVQFWDDAIDAEEDFRAGNFTWTVARTLSGTRESLAKEGRTDRDAFYEKALEGGTLIETLRQAESCFESSALAVGDEFPSWTSLQRACISQTRDLRTDLQNLASQATQRRELRTGR